MRRLLKAQAKAKVPGGMKIAPGVHFKPKNQQPKGTGIETKLEVEPSETVNEFVGFTYSAGCAEVEIDILTGETKIKRVDNVYDMGKSLNPAIDIGQIEGGFIQGVGYVLTEDLVCQSKGKKIGKLNSLNTWRYKPPAVTKIPLEKNVSIFPRCKAKGVLVETNTLFSSKEVGEPPMVLANAVFFAAKSAIRAFRKQQNLSEHFNMSSPASIQTVFTACHPKSGSPQN